MLSLLMLALPLASAITQNFPTDGSHVPQHALDGSYDTDGSYVVQQYALDGSYARDGNSFDGSYARDGNFKKIVDNRKSEATTLGNFFDFSVVVWILLGFSDEEASSIFKATDTSKENTPVRPVIEVPKVNVDVYYECLCPDSRYFVTHQLYPAWQVASEIMKVNFWPYGKATTEKTKHGYKFNCQHGEKECLGDMIHACAAHLVSNADLRMEYIKCMVADHDYDPEKAGATCAKQIGVDWSAVNACASSYEGQELHAEAGLKTQALEPKVSFIPTIEIDSSQGSQKALLKNFLLEICKAYQDKTGEKGPQGCIDKLSVV